jgi:hypothetical protein
MLKNKREKNYENPHCWGFFFESLFRTSFHNLDKGRFLV